MSLQGDSRLNEADRVARTADTHGNPVIHLGADSKFGIATALAVASLGGFDRRDRAASAAGRIAGRIT